MMLEALRRKYPTLRQIIVTYNGYGDSTELFEVKFETEDHDVLDSVKEDEELVRDWCLKAFADGGQDGWWNNEGGEGAFVINVTSGEVQWEHTNFYTERDTSYHTLDISKESHGEPDRSL